MLALRGSGSVEIKPEDDGRSTIDEILASTSAAAPERDVQRGQGLFDYGEEEPDEDYKPADVNSHSLALGIDAQEEEEKKAKPLLEMRYQGSLLCLVAFRSHIAVSS